MMTGHAKKLKKTLKKQREASKDGLLKCKSNTLKSGFTKCSSDNVPMVDSRMIYNFIWADNRFLNSNNRTGKLERATRES